MSGDFNQLKEEISKDERFQVIEERETSITVGYNHQSKDRIGTILKVIKGWGQISHGGEIWLDEMYRDSKLERRIKSNLEDDWMDNQSNYEHSIALAHLHNAYVNKENPQDTFGSKEMEYVRTHLRDFLLWTPRSTREDLEDQYAFREWVLNEISTWEKDRTTVASGTSAISSNFRDKD